MNHNKRKIPVFWGFLIINFLLIFSSTSYLFLHWKSFSENIAYDYYNESAEEIGRMITSDFKTGHEQASKALSAPSKLMQEAETFEFLNTDTTYFQNFLTTMLVPNNISRFGIYIPNRGHIESWTDNFDIYYNIDVSGNPDNGTFHYQTGKGWEKSDHIKPDNFNNFFASPWMEDLYENPGKLMSSNPWINVQNGELGLRVGKYIRNTNNTHGIRDIVIYCDCFYTISTDFFDPFIDIEVNKYSSIKTADTRVFAGSKTQKHPILIIDEDKNIFLSENKDNFAITNKNNSQLYNNPIINAISEGFKNDEFFLPENNDTIFHYNIPQKGYPNCMVIILRVENSKWWIAMVFSGTIIDSYNSLLNKALFWALIVTIIIYFILYIIIRNLIVKPISIINERITGMKDLTFIRKSYNSPVLELDNINSSLSTFEASFKSFLKFVPREMLLEQLSTGKEVTTGWEEKEMSVLMCQIKNFYNIATSRNEFYEQLSTFIEVFNSIVIENNGSILNPEEMRFNAIWSREKNPQTMADKACLSTIRIINKISELNETWKNFNKSTFECNFFVFTDTISIGNIGTENKLHYHIFGEKVYQNTDLIEKTWAEEITFAIDENTADLLTGNFITRPLSKIKLTEKTEKTIYQIFSTTETKFLYPDINLFCNNFRTGWKLFYNNEYEKSLQVFSEFSTKYPEDTYARKYMSLCEEKIAAENKGSNKDILGIK